MVMMLTKEKIEKAIALSQAFSDYLAPSYQEFETFVPGQKMGAHAEEMRKIEASEQCQALKGFLHSLSDVELRELQAIMFIGRGDYRPEDFTRAFEETSLDSNRDHEVRYMIEKMSASDYFADGFEKLNRARMI